MCEQRFYNNSLQFILSNQIASLLYFEEWYQSYNPLHFKQSKSLYHSPNQSKYALQLVLLEDNVEDGSAGSFYAEGETHTFAA